MSRYTLYDFQKRSVIKTIDLFRAGRHGVMLVMPTGSGKTVTYCYIAEQLIRNNDYHIMVIAHKDEIINQVVASIQRFIGIQPGIITPNGLANYESQIQVASIQTLYSRLDQLSWLLRRQDLIIIEEAHHTPNKTYIDVLSRCGSNRLLGVTATPCRLDGVGFDFHVDRFGNTTTLYDDMVNEVSIRDLEAMDMLVPAKVYDLLGINYDLLKKIAYKHSKNEFTDSELAFISNSSDLTEKAVAAYRTLCPNETTITFACSLAHSKAIAAAYNAAGISAAHIGSNYCLDEYARICPREAIIARWKSGHIKVLVNRDIAIEGLDNPPTTVVQVLRPIKSLSGALQMFGRGTRRAPGKSHYKLLDHVGITLMHGAPNADRTWSLKGSNSFASTVEMLHPNNILYHFQCGMTKYNGDQYRAFAYAVRRNREPVEPYELMQIADTGHFTKEWAKRRIYEYCRV